jgi:hypothetical protein
MKTRLVIGLMMPVMAWADGADNFDDNSKDPTKWGADVGGPGVLTEQNQRLEFTCSNAFAEGDTWRPWILHRFPVNASWTIQIDTVNSSEPPTFGQLNSAGFTLFHPTTSDSELYTELYAVPFGKGFVSNLITEDNTVGDTDSGAFLSGTVMAAVRVEYNGATKVANSFYDDDTSNGYQWTPLASYGLAGSGGTTTNTNWNLTNDQQLSVWVYGYSAFMTISSGEVYLDNFAETGGVPPTGGPAPVPTGSFTFGFPTNNPLLTAIAYLGGNYGGMLPQVGRAYTLDVAQDEAGKLMVIGTVDGVTDSTGNPQLASDIGGIKTVDGQPTVESKGAFQFMVDGEPGSSKGTARIPLEMVDIGGGTNGLIGTTTGSATAFGVPVSFKNTPIAAPETPDMQMNFRKGWSIQLDISQQTINGKPVTMASALLTLPSGDIVSFPAKKVKYSTTKGYKLNFTKGTNLSTGLVEKKTKIKITGLTFVKVGDEWEPTGGVIGYQFLGQKGTANLLDFEQPF